MKSRERIRRLIGDKTFSEVAKKWSISEYTVRTFINNEDRQMSMASYVNIAKAEKVSLDWLLGLERGREVRRPTHEVSDALKGVERYEPRNEVEEIKRDAYVEAFRWVLRKDERDEKIQRGL